MWKDLFQGPDGGARRPAWSACRFRGLSAGVLLGLLAGCGCDHLVVTEQARMGGDLKAAVFTSACGLNVSVNTRVSILPATKPTRGKANVFAVIVGEEDGATTSRGGPMVTTTWVGKDTLLVTYGRSALVRARKETFEGVVIRYRVEESW